MKILCSLFLAIFILSVKVPLAYSLIEPVRFVGNPASKALIQGKSGFDQDLKIVHGKKRLRRRGLRGKRFRRKKVRRRNSISAKSRAIRNKFRSRTHR